MPPKILCVAEKPSIAKAVANHLGGGRVRTSNVQYIAYVKNYEFSFDFPTWGTCNVVMTSVLGHLLTCDFTGRYAKWSSCDPEDLFEAPVSTFIPNDKKYVAENIRRQARGARALFIWTDCDREGENIGAEIRGVVWEENRNIEVKRARFSNIEGAHVLQAARNPIGLDDNQANAVFARQELDLRIGASFTRMQTMSLKPLGPQLEDLKAVSYGSCQFPTLGFVVDRYFRVRRFKPEPFWKIQVFHKRDGIRVAFSWKRVHLFDRMVTTLLFERCIATPNAKVTDVSKRPTSKWRPLPLTTVELQKNGSRFLRMDSARVMDVAERLYQGGFISYPRTETDQFDSGMDLRALIARQTEHARWGDYAQSLLDANYRTPRAGRNNDQAHPPIHPVNPAPDRFESDEHARVYEFVVRRFLACCSEDAKGEMTTVTLAWSTESFSAHGLLVLARNYLDVYPYDKWESSQQLPPFVPHEEFRPAEAKMEEGQTTRPHFLTEPELIALMDANGIGTDATMAEHIAKIKERQYVMVQPRGGGGPVQPAPRGGGGRGGGGRGRGGRGRGGAAASSRGNPSSATLEFIPTTLGTALITAYESMNLELSLGKPFLRKEMELQMKEICAGRTTRNDVVQLNIESYRAAYRSVARRIDVLKGTVRRFVVEGQTGL